MDKISLQGKCSILNIQGQMVRISLQEEKQYLKYVITIIMVPKKMQRTYLFKGLGPTYTQQFQWGNPG